MDDFASPARADDAARMSMASMRAREEVGLSLEERIRLRKLKL